MSRRIRIAPDALVELDEAAEWYEARNPGMGQEFVATVDAAIVRILEAPLAFKRWREDRPYRVCILERFPFSLFYVVDPGEIEVMAVAHSRRRPGYWLGRQR